MDFFYTQLRNIRSEIEDYEQCAIVIDQWLIVLEANDGDWHVDDISKLSHTMGPGLLFFPYIDRHLLLRWDEPGFGIFFEPIEELKQARLAQHFGFCLSVGSPYLVRHQFPLFEHNILRMVRDCLEKRTVSEAPAVQTLSQMIAEIDPSSPVRGRQVTAVVLRQMPEIYSLGKYQAPAVPKITPSLEHVATCCQAVQASNLLQFVFSQTQLTAIWSKDSDEWELYSLDTLANGIVLPEMLWVQRNPQFHDTTIDINGFGISRDDRDQTKDSVRNRSLLRSIHGAGLSLRMHDTTADLLFPCLGHLTELLEPMRELCRNNRILDGIGLFDQMRRDAEQGMRKPSAPRTGAVARSRLPSLSSRAEPMRVWRISPPED